MGAKYKSDYDEYELAGVEGLWKEPSPAINQSPEEGYWLNTSDIEGKLKKTYLTENKKKLVDDRFRTPEEMGVTFALTHLEMKKVI